MASPAYMKVRDMESFLSDLQPFMDLTKIEGVSIGDWGFVSPQDFYSTTFFTPSAINALGANLNGGLFQAAIGDAGQGLGAGNVMTIAQTNWKSTGGRLGANEAFVGMDLGFKVFKLRCAASNGVTAANLNSGGGPTLALASSVLIPNTAALTQIVNNLSWFYNIGNTIPRTVGPIAAWPQGAGAWMAPPQITAGSIAGVATGVTVGNTFAFTATLTGTVQPGQAAQNGAPWALRRAFDAPFVFPPNINVLVGVQSGNAMLLPSQAAVDNTSLPDGGNTTLQFTSSTSNPNAPYVEFLAVQAAMRGYLLTSNV